MDTTNTIAALKPLTGNALEQFIVRGDLSVLTPDDKAKHYLWVCERVGLDPATKPFEYLKLNGREVLYCKREGTDQLRKVHSVAVQITNRERVDDVYVVSAKATLPDGRIDESQGAVTIGNLKGDALANAIMKAETKAKRRVTLSIIGLGMLDESELDTVQPDRFAVLREHVAQPEAPQVKLVKEVLGEKKKAEGLPPVPEVVTKIPPTLLLAYSQIQHLNDVELKEMSTEDLELLIETLGNGYKQRQAKGNTSELGMSWFRAVIATATALLGERVPQ